MTNLLDLLQKSLQDDTFIAVIFSNPRLKLNSYRKMTGKLVLIKDEVMIQFSKEKDQKVFHENVRLMDLASYLEAQTLTYKQIQLYTTLHDYHLLINKQGEVTTKELPATKDKPNSPSHNREKNYLLSDESSQAFLKALGVMDQNGQIKPTKSDKFKQINKYLEFISDVVPKLDHQDIVRIVDFGCGKSYLTFALYHYMTVILHKKVEIIGLDLKEDVISFCNSLAMRLNFKDLHFQVGDIGHYTTDQEIDIVVSLHACNTATDAALAKAISWKAKIIFAVPCCHHELYTQIENDVLKPVLKYGILKERMAALLTDGLRANLLECFGYKVNVMEFIDMEHTPKNILIRAIQMKDGKLDSTLYQNYLTLSETLNANLSLPRFLNIK